MPIFNSTHEKSKRLDRKRRFLPNRFGDHEGCCRCHVGLGGGDGAQDDSVEYQDVHSCCFVFLHASEQYFTCPQTFAHFFRQAKGRLQTGQIFVGKLGFLWVT